MQDDEIPKMFFGPVFPELIQGKGGGADALLPGGEMVNHSFFAWYFCKLAMIQLEQIPEQVTYTDDLDTIVNLRDTCENLQMVYGIQGSDELEKAMKLMPTCRRIAFQRGIKWDDRFQAWIDSGGKSYNKIDREPDKLNEST